MSKAKFERSKPHVNIGTIGHVDHGKTTLTAAITTVLAQAGGAEAFKYDEIDKAPEEKKEESQSTQHTLSTKQLTDTTLTLTVQDMLTTLKHDHWSSSNGRSYISCSAADGPMPQTREHILLSSRVGVDHIVVFLNKADMVDDEELLELVEMEVRELLSEYNFPGDDIPVIKGSALVALETQLTKLQQLVSES